VLLYEKRSANSCASHFVACSCERQIDRALWAHFLLECAQISTFHMKILIKKINVLYTKACNADSEKPETRWKAKQTASQLLTPHSEDCQIIGQNIFDMIQDFPRPSWYYSAWMQPPPKSPKKRAEQNSYEFKLYVRMLWPNHFSFCKAVVSEPT
jgi:hypothetical protein